MCAFASKNLSDGMTYVLGDDDLETYNLATDSYSVSIFRLLENKFKWLWHNGTEADYRLGVIDTDAQGTDIKIQTNRTEDMG
jgi:hypothetical protein